VQEVVEYRFKMSSLQCSRIQLLFTVLTYF